MQQHTLRLLHQTSAAEFTPFSPAGAIHEHRREQRTDVQFLAMRTDTAASTVDCSFPESSVVRVLLLVRKLRRHFILLLGFCVLGAGPAAADASSENAREYGIKSAFLYNFTKFVGWPAQPPEREPGFAICVVASIDVVAIVQTTLDSKRAAGGRVRVRQLETPEQIAECHLAFVTAPHRASLPEWTAAGLAYGVLVVSEADEFGAEIGMINLVVLDNRIQLEIERTTTERAGLMLSSSLLSLATLRESRAGTPASPGTP